MNKAAARTHSQKAWALSFIAAFIIIGIIFLVANLVFAVEWGKILSGVKL